MEATLCFEAMTTATLPACAALAATAPDPWGKAALARVMEDANHWNFVALRGGAVVGFASFLALADSCDLELIVVETAARRQGAAKALLAHAFAQLCAQGVARCLLEVRASNTGAIGLYQALGFKTLARRPGMYQTPAEDGFLMAKAL